MACLLGLDIGTSSTKALLLGADGGVVGRGSAGYPISQPEPDRAEQDPDDWWRAAADSTRQALSAASVSGETVSAVGLSGQMHGTILLDEAGEPVAPAVIWPDQRSAAQVAEINEMVGPEHLVEITGSPVATGLQAATIRWIQENQPEIWRHTSKVVLPKDYVRYRMTGILATDPSDGSGTLLLDVHRREWSTELLESLGIDLDHMPRIQEGLSVAGTLTREAATALGLQEGTPVVTGAADTACSLLGAGITSSRTLLLTLGTGGQLVLPRADAAIDRAGRIHTLCGALSAETGGVGWYHMAAILSAGRSLSWLRDSVFGMAGPGAYDEMTRWAEAVPPGAGGLLFLPYLAGERSPHMDPLASGMFLGLRASHGRGHLVRAVLEGVVLACYDAYAVLAELGASPESVVAAGGGARSGLWRQIVADVFALPVCRWEGADQSAMGAALLAGGGVGLLDVPAAAAEFATYGRAIEPSAAGRGPYAELYAVFRAAYQKHRGDFRRLRALSSRIPGDHSGGAA
jgi:xylulokinase